MQAFRCPNLGQADHLRIKTGLKFVATRQTRRTPAGLVQRRNFCNNTRRPVAPRRVLQAQSETVGHLTGADRRALDRRDRHAASRAGEQSTQSRRR